MPAQILDGRALARSIREQIKERVARLPSPPGLGVILVGTDPASHLYVGLKEQACREANIRFEKKLYFATVSEAELIAQIEQWNGRDDIDGILVQLPLPHQDEDRVIAAINPDKDVDGFHPENIRRLDVGQLGMVSAVALGVMRLIKETGRPLTNLSAAIVASRLFAHPIIKLLENEGVTSCVIAPDDPDLAGKTKTADILIVAVGKPGLIVAPSVKPGAIVIDVGTTRIGDSVVGDVDRTSVEPIAGWLTPVPGGVGPMTVAMLIENVLRAHEQRKKG